MEAERQREQALIALQATAAVANALAAVLPELPLSSDDLGGFFCLVDTSQGAEHLGAQLTLTALGSVPDELRSHRRELAQEKTVRLAAHPAHASAWTTRARELRRYGGAIRARRYILSFSGLSEHADEAVMLLAALQLDWLTEDQASGIAATSDNALFRRMLLRHS